MSRREFSPKVRLAAFERAAGHCEECSARLYPGKFEYDHEIADGLGGEPTLENCVVKCSACHGVKTKLDVTKIAKTKRIRKRAAGIKRRGRIRGWKKFDGTPVRAGETT